jgi:predicted MFS family arabinose efflux permease
MSLESAAVAPVSKPAEDLSTAYKIYALCLLVLVYISNYTDRVLLTVLMPAIKAEFSLSDFELGLLSGTAFALFYAILGVPIAVLADRSSRKLVIVGSVAIWSLMTAACGAAQSFTQLLLARVGVGVGEAGSNPPSHAIIADMFSLKARATALGIYSQGVSIGLVIGIYGGAQLAEAYGWRVAFYALGLPGLLISLLVLLTLREPRRGASEGTATVGRAPPLMDVIRFMLSQRALVHTFVGSTLATTVGYSGVLWWPTFIVRSHGLSMADMSLFLALVFGLASGLGIFFGGFAADKFASRNVEWMPRVVTWAILIGLPFGVAIYLVDNSSLVFLLIAIPAFTGGFYLSPSLSIAQSLVGVRMRVVASGLLLFVITIIGMGLGSALIGALSDALEPAYGKDALRYALLSFMVFNLWAAYHYWQAGRDMEGDLKRAAEASK